jgi:hypothetical protein
MRMTLKTVRNVAFVLMVGSAMAASRTLQADSGCYVCDGHDEDPYTWCTPFPGYYHTFETGGTQCLDRNSGQSNCAFNGTTCFSQVN